MTDHRMDSGGNGSELIAQLSATFEHSPVPVILTTRDIEAPGPHILYVNPALIRATGYSREELIGTSPRILQGPDTDRREIDRLRQTLARGEDFHGRILNYRKDGGKILFDWYVSPIRGADGKITHWISIQPVLKLAEREKDEAGTIPSDIKTPKEDAFARATLLYRELVTLDFSDPDEISLVLSLPIAIVVVDARGRVLFANGRAEELASDKDGLAISAGTLHASDAELDASLQAIISTVAMSETATLAESARTLALPRSSGIRPSWLVAAALPPDRMRSPSMPAESRRAVLIVFDPDRQRTLGTDLLRALFGLTKAEAAVADRIIAGKSLAIAAEQLGISRNTARNHLQRVFQRTGTNRQPDLVRLVLSNPLWRSAIL